MYILTDVFFPPDKSGAMARREPQDLSVTVELGVCHCSRLPGKVDNQTDRGNTRLSQR